MLTARERFRAICRFERADDPCMWSVESWNETYERWVREGMPVRNIDNRKELSLHLLGYQDQMEWIGPNGAIMGMGKNNNPPWCVAIDPVFETTVIREEPEHIVHFDYDGSIVRRRRFDDQSIPQYLEYPVKDEASWMEYRKRLDPFSHGRWPAGWEIMTDDKLKFPIRPGQAGRHFEERDFPLGMVLFSLYGNIRNYMGLENLSYAIHDNIKFIEEMLDWQTYLAYEMLKKVIAAGVTLDYVWIWEDMCYKNGPLISPAFVKKYMVPRYRKVVDLLLEHNVAALVLDSDGNLDSLLPIWVDCGINATYPLECAAGMDARKLRQKFGKNLILIGNIDKRSLAASKKEIDEELAKARQLLAYGGYFPNADHHIPPDVSYEAIVYFLNELRKLSAYEETRRFIPMPASRTHS